MLKRKIKPSFRWSIPRKGQAQSPTSRLRIKQWFTHRKIQDLPGSQHWLVLVPRQLRIHRPRLAIWTAFNLDPITPPPHAVGGLIRYRKQREPEIVARRIRVAHKSDIHRLRRGQRVVSRHENYRNKRECEDHQNKQESPPFVNTSHDCILSELRRSSHFLPRVGRLRAS